MSNQFRNFLIVFMVCGLAANVFYAQRWETAPSLNTPRWGATSVELGGYIYVMGGATTNGVILNTVERYDPVTQTWDDSVVPAFNIPRLNAAAIVFNGKIYLIGGRNNQTHEIDDVEVYDPQTGLWTFVQDMDKKREGHFAVLLNGKICVMGGVHDSEYEEEIEWYDDLNDDWEDSPTDLTNLVAAPFAASVNDTLYMFGGFFNVPLATGWRAVADTNWAFTWMSAPNLQTARGSGATALFGDSLFMIGGNTISGATNIVEIYNFRTHQIETGLSAPTPRIGMTASTWNDTIFVIGGYDQTPSQPLTLVEIYHDPPVDIRTPPPVELPQTFAHIRGYPNPFNGAINLEIELSRGGTADVSIFDIQGRKITTLYQGVLNSGAHTFRWDGTDNMSIPVASGVYIAVLRTGGFLQNFKMLYVK